MIETVKSRGNYFTSLNILLILSLLLIVELLVLNTKIGMIALIAGVLFITVLVKPKIIYFLMISFLSFEGLGLSGVSSVRIVGVLLTLGLALRLLMTKGSIPKDNTYKYFLLFFAGSIVSFAVATNLSLSVTTFITYISLFFLYIFTRYFLKASEDVNSLLNYIFISTILIFAIVQIPAFSVRDVAEERISSGIGDSNEFASYIMAILPLVLYRAMNSSGFAMISYWGCLVCFLLLLIYSGSRGGLLGFLGAAAVLIYYYGVGRLRQILLFVLILVVILHFFVPDYFWYRVETIAHPEAEKGRSISTRLENYIAAIKMFLDHPFAGVGLTNFRIVSRAYGASGGLAVHNTYLEILTGGGLLTFIPFLLILVNIWRKLKPKRHYEKNMRDLLICLQMSIVAILITLVFFSGDKSKILWFMLALSSSAHYISINQRSHQNAGFFHE